MASLSLERLTLEQRAAAAEKRMSSFLSSEQYEGALEAAIEALESYIKARRTAANALDREKLGKKCEELMKKAEEVKKLDKQLREKGSSGRETTAAVTTPHLTAAAPGLLPLAAPSLTAVPSKLPKKPPQLVAKVPSSTRSLTVKEETILLKSSKISGHIFPPWKTPPAPSEFPSEQFSDPSGFLGLSDSQHSILAGWKRPHEIYDGKHVIVPEEGDVLDLAQDVITDCSVVASLCAAIGREERGFGKIVSNTLYPQNANGEPEISPSGKYIVKLYFNGCYRKVVIDDYLPTSKNSRALYVVCRKKPTHFAPALIEKAYLKLMGGYDFPGSNSGTDLLALTGWIPEHVFIQSDDMVPGALWRRVYKAWGYGDVLITLGTGRMVRREELELGLVGEHDYAVLDLKEENGTRMILVKNPWSEGTVWRGAPAEFSSDEDDDEDDNGDSEDEDEDDDDDDDSEDGKDEDEDKDSDDDEEEEEEGDFDAPEAPSFDTKDLLHALPQTKNTSPPSSSAGVFWISLESVCRHFASIYLNWNPALFTHRYDHHFSWDLATKKSEGSFGGNPQFSLENPRSKPATVWLLLGRHVGLTGNREGMVKTGYISLYVFERSGRQIYLSDGALHRGPYVDSPQTLLRLDAIPPATTYTIAVSSQDLSKSVHSFTLSALSITPMKISPAIDPYTFHRSIPSAWTSETAGGNAHSPSYSCNPQFRLSVSSSCDVMLLLETRDPLPIHVKIVWGGGKRIATVTTRDIIAESGEYRRGCALAETTALQPGDYTIVASTFEPGQMGEFTLQVGTTTPDAIFEILPAESAGKLQKIISGDWGNGGVVRILFPLKVERLTSMSAKARTTFTRSRAIPPLRISVQRGGMRDVVGSSSLEGDFSDRPQGVRTGELDLERGSEYAIVLERMGQGESGWEVQVLSDGAVRLGEKIEESE
ncbi:cysteine protease [Rhizina undulata]